jgi:hypothetical protein
MGVMTYEGVAGEHISESAKEAIALAAKHNCKVRIRFNGIRLTVNKRMSVRHIFRMWRHAEAAASLRYHNSPEAIASKARWQKEVAKSQLEIDLMMRYLPKEKEDAIAWLASWIPLADKADVNYYGPLVAEHLRSIGFVSGQYVDAPEFKDGTASRMMHIEYIAGQVVSMLEGIGIVHPILGRWAEQVMLQPSDC